MNWLTKTFEIKHSNHTSLKAMEGLRGIAIFLVFLVHYCSLVETYVVQNSWVSRSLFFIHQIGNSGVDLFFVLSGYLIYGMLIRKPKPFFPYLYRRIMRIYPTFLVVLVAYIALSYVFPSESKLPYSQLDKFIYICQNVLLLPGLFNIEPIITVAWSLSYEFFFYLLIPLLIPILKLRAWGANQRVLFFGIFTLFGFLFFQKYGQHTRLMMFISGILLFEVKNNYNIKLPKYSGIISLFVALTITGLKSSIALVGVWQVLLIFILFFILCLESFSDQKGSSSIFVFTPLRWLGNMSYSYYLVHGLTLKFSFLVLSSFVKPAYQFESIFWLLWLPLFFITLIVASGLFIIIERPLSLNYRKPRKVSNNYFEIVQNR